MKRLMCFLLYAALVGVFAHGGKAQWIALNRRGNVNGSPAENDCYLPAQTTFANGAATITTAAQSTVCSDVNGSGTYSYITDLLQWGQFSFTYGTITFRAALPAQNTATWPAIWMLGTNCQASTVLTAGTYGSCVSYPDPSYTEIDMFECGSPFGGWCQIHMFANGSAPSACSFAVSDTNYHTWVLTWSASTVALTMDGVSTGCSYSSGSSTIPSGPMYLAIGTQVVSASNSHLPTTFKLSYVEVQDASNNIIFYDHFNHMSMLPTSLSSGAF